MKNLKKQIFTLLLLVITSVTFAQNKNVSVKAEKVDEGVKITTTENGKTSSMVVNLADAKRYLEELGNDIEVNVEDLGDNKYQVKYKSDEGKTETVEIDIDEMLENLSISFENLGEDLEKMIEDISSQIEYEEKTDKDGNKVIKVKTVKAEN